MIQNPINSSQREATVSSGSRNHGVPRRGRRRPGRRTRQSSFDQVEEHIGNHTSWADQADLEDTIQSDRRARNRGQPQSGLEDRIRERHAAAVERGASQQIRFEPGKYPVLFDTAMLPTLPIEREEVIPDVVQFCTSITDLLKTLMRDEGFSRVRHYLPGDEDENQRNLGRDLLAGALFQLAQRLVDVRANLGLQKGSVSRITQYQVSTLKSFSDLVSLFGEFVDDTVARTMILPTYETFVKKILYAADCITRQPDEVIGIDGWLDRLRVVGCTALLREAPLSAGETEIIRSERCMIRSRLSDRITGARRPLRRDFFSLVWEDIDDHNTIDTELKANMWSSSYLFHGVMGLPAAPSDEDRRTWINGVMANDPTDPFIGGVFGGQTFDITLPGLAPAPAAGWRWQDTLGWTQVWQMSAASLSQYLVLSEFDKSPLTYPACMATLHHLAVDGPYLRYRSASVVPLDAASMAALLGSRVVSTREDTAHTTANVDVQFHRTRLLRKDIRVT
jgi:hypothetical protein